ncbi:LytR/AlgR family response regulator transcription factor [Haliscomenobacter hydrossis]|uniref:Two component transcriptional regulator, LytTR family n=1 Tax=Haliscomenobacter hydrossis (strain ATCC 27775 / DSM 1100 / LMG 10767 / O) TaxID=760192 RepID=F4KUA0_HALH1|nr:LytTR family DNA-binding domain-containing protein [Haliscomenobacter hydrossis]AEE50197.1 two component transcriptional regulator, LytTR family [Haliscomenobacter hydrossis DSM 1100]
MKVLIVEDEPKTAQDLSKTLLKIDPSITILGITDSIEGTVNFLAYPPAPDLIFLDIQLADGLSFDLFKEATVACPVVFCSTHREDAYPAFQTNSIAFVLKPFHIEDLRFALNKFKMLANFYRAESPDLQALTEALSESGGLKSNFLVASRGNIVPIPTKAIAMFYITGEEVCLQTFDNNIYLINHSLEEIEKMVGNKQFFRANRQYLINYELIESVEPGFARKLKIKPKIKSPDPITVSKAKASDFLSWMNAR